MIVNETGTTKVYDFHLTAAVTFHKYVFRLKITMNQTQRMYVLQRRQYLESYSLKTAYSEKDFILIFSIIPAELI